MSRSLIDIISLLLTPTISERLLHPDGIRNSQFFSFIGFCWRDFEVRKIVPPVYPNVDLNGSPFYADCDMHDQLPRSRYDYNFLDVHDSFEGF